MTRAISKVAFCVALALEVSACGGEPFNASSDGAGGVVGKMPLEPASTGGASGGSPISSAGTSDEGTTYDRSGANSGGHSSMGQAGSIAAGSSSGGAAGSSGGGAAGSSGGGAAGSGSVGIGVDPVCFSTNEVCDGADNDCDGLIDEGCPPSVGWNNQTNDAFLGGSDGGTAFSDTCAAGEVVAGISFGLDNWIFSLQAICRKLTFVGPSMIELGEPHSLSEHPVTVGLTHPALDCPVNSVVVGMRVQQMPYTASGVAHIVTPAVWITCAEPTLNFGSGAPTIGWQGASELGPISTGWIGSATLTASDQLASPKAVVGLQGNGGNWIDRPGLISATLTFAVNPPEPK